MDHTQDLIEIDGNGGVSSCCCCCCEPCDPNEWAECSCVSWWSPLAIKKSSSAYPSYCLGLGFGDATCPLADLACADIAAATATVTAAEDDVNIETDDPMTVLDRSQAYVHAPWRAAAASCWRCQWWASWTYGFLGCSVLPNSHWHQMYCPGTPHQWKEKNLAYVQEGARC